MRPILKGHGFRVLITVAISLASTPSWSWANSNLDDLFANPLSNGKHYVDRVKTIIEEMRNYPAIRQLADRQDHTLNAVQKVAQNGIETVKFQDYYKGIEVVGSMALYHAGAKSTEISNFLNRFDIDTIPTLAKTEAVAIAKSQIGERFLRSVPVLKILPDSDDNTARLVYWVDLKGTETESGHDLVIDAHSGDTIADIPHWQTLAPIEIYQASSKCQTTDPRTGRPISYDIAQCDHTVVKSEANGEADASALQAMSNSSSTLSYYYDRHGRDSYDGSGSSLISTVHIGDHFDNAFWDTEKEMMFYGDGDGKETGDFTRGVDVAGHEMTHGVTSKTAKLIYMDQSGALSEAYSDFFGMMISEDEEWILGKKLFIDQTKAEGFRNLANPHAITVPYKDADGSVKARPYPAHMNEIFKSTGLCGRANDNCWVHVNATIPGHASYLVAKAIGREKAEKLYFTVLTQYLVPRATFRSARTSTIKACKQLFDTATCEQVKTAYSQVGL